MATRNETLNLVKSYINDVKTIMPIDKVYLYGSYAKGTENSYSDIDICFFLKEFENKKRHEILLKLVTLGNKYCKDICIEPNVFPLSDMKSDNPFVKEILRTGFEI